MTDKLTIRLVVGFLGLIALVVVVGGFWLAHDRIEIPAELIALGSAAAGGVGALLARTSSESEAPVRTIVENAPTDPIPTAPTLLETVDDGHTISEEDLAAIEDLAEPEQPEEEPRKGKR